MSLEPVTGNQGNFSLYCLKALRILTAEQARRLDRVDANRGAADVPEAVRQDPGGPPCRRADNGDDAEQLQHVQLRREEGGGAVHGRRAGRQEQLPRPRVRHRRPGLPPAGAAPHHALPRLPTVSCPATDADPCSAPSVCSCTHDSGIAVFTV